LSSTKNTCLVVHNPKEIQIKDISLFFLELSSTKNTCLVVQNQKKIQITAIRLFLLDLDHVHMYAHTYVYICTYVGELIRIVEGCGAGPSFCVEFAETFIYNLTDPSFLHLCKRV
jgi:hypothetical protein